MPTFYDDDGLNLDVHFTYYLHQIRVNYAYYIDIDVQIRTYNMTLVFCSN